MRALLCVMTVLVMGVAVGAGSSSPRKTEVVRWSPFDSAGRIKTTLKVENVKGGSCIDIGYTLVGGIGYRCVAGNGLYDACWRDGPNPTESVICLGAPWQTTVERLRSPHLLLYPGVTFEPAADYPWSIVLGDGNRCTVVQGAHDGFSAHGKRFIVDYACERDNVVLLREGLDRGALWRANAARRDAATSQYVVLGQVSLQRVYFGRLPMAMARQNTLAEQAVMAARRIIRRQEPQVNLALVWVRLALPRSDWAYVIFSMADDSAIGRFSLLRRVNNVWTDGSAYMPYCKNVPRQARAQLFLGRHTWNPVPGGFLAPGGETRC